MQTDQIYRYPHLIVELLQQRLAERADPTYAEWYRHNVKPTAPVRGVRMQDLRHLVMAWHQEWQQQNQSSTQISIQLDVTFLLFHAEYVDDRLAAMVFIDEVLIPAQLVTPDLLERLSTLFPPGLISDFKACDHFAAKVLQPLLIRYGSQVSDQLLHWFSATSVWQARAALSALTPLASDAIYDDLLVMGCGIVLSRSEEEAKSIVGSALRALGKVRPELVEAFLSDSKNLLNTNAACLNKATSFLEAGRAQHFREQRRMLIAWSSQMGSSHSAIPCTSETPPNTMSHSGYRSTGSSISLPTANTVLNDVPAPLRASPTIPPIRSLNVRRRRDEIEREIREIAEGGTFEGTDRERYLNREVTDSLYSPMSSVGLLVSQGTRAAITTSQMDIGTGTNLGARMGSHTGPGPGSETNLFSLGGFDPLALPKLSEEGRSVSIGGVAHGRITRTDSGLRRRHRRISGVGASLNISGGIFDAREGGERGGEDGQDDGIRNSRRAGGEGKDGNDNENTGE